LFSLSLTLLYRAGAVEVVVLTVVMGCIAMGATVVVDTGAVVATATVIVFISGSGAPTEVRPVTETGADAMTVPVKGVVVVVVVVAAAVVNGADVVPFTLSPVLLMVLSTETGAGTDNDTDVDAGADTFKGRLTLLTLLRVVLGADVSSVVEVEGAGGRVVLYVCGGRREEVVVFGVNVVALDKAVLVPVVVGKGVKVFC
jgi:hypothetical protein